MTRQEFIQKYRATIQASNRRGWIFLTIISGTAIVSAGLMQLFLMPLEQKGYFDWVVFINEYSIRGIFGCFVLMYAFAIYYVSPSDGVPCQTCGRKLFGTNVRLALITGNCGFCGDKALDANGSCSADLLKSIRFHD